MSEPMPYGEMVQELTRLRAQYEQFIIDRERERIIKLLEGLVETMTAEWNDPSEIYGAEQAIALIKGEEK